MASLPIVGAAAAVFLAAAQFAFQSGTVLLVAAPLLALVLTAVGALAVDFFAETREWRRLRATLSRFVPEAVVDQVVERGDARLGGERLVSTALFCDLRGFTSFSESLQAEQVIDLLNQMGIGLNSGPVMSGNVGSERRMEYTAVGDTTNTASRPEGMTKNSGTSSSWPTRRARCCRASPQGSCTTATCRCAAARRCSRSGFRRNKEHGRPQASIITNAGTPRVP